MENMFKGRKVASIVLFILGCVAFVIALYLYIAIYSQITSNKTGKEALGSGLAILFLIAPIIISSVSTVVFQGVTLGFSIFLIKHKELPKKGYFIAQTVVSSLMVVAIIILFALLYIL